MRGKRIASDSGSLVAELAMTFPIFIMFLLIGFETLRFHYNYIAVQIMVNRGVEMVRINPVSGNATANPAQNIAGQLQTFARGLGFDDATLKICITTQNASPNCLQDIEDVPNCLVASSGCAVGQDRQIFLVRVQRSIPLAFGLRTLNVDAVGIGRHEPRSTG